MSECQPLCRFCRMDEVSHEGDVCPECMKDWYEQEEYDRGFDTSSYDHSYLYDADHQFYTRRRSS